MWNLNRKKYDFFFPILRLCLDILYQEAQKNGMSFFILSFFLEFPPHMFFLHWPYQHLQQNSGFKTFFLSSPESFLNMVEVSHVHWPKYPQIAFYNTTLYFKSTLKVSFTRKKGATCLRRSIIPFEELNITLMVCDKKAPCLSRRVVGIMDESFKKILCCRRKCSKPVDFDYINSWNFTH